MGHMCSCCPKKEKERNFTELYNCVCFFFFFFSAHFLDRLYITTGHSYWFTTLFLHIFQFFFALQFSFSFTFFPPSLVGAATWKVKTKNISWWWNINRSKKFNYINSLFLDSSSTHFSLDFFFQFHFSFQSISYETTGNSFVKLHFRNWRVSEKKKQKWTKAGQEKWKTLMVKEVLIWYRFRSFRNCSIYVNCCVM